MVEGSNTVGEIDVVVRAVLDRYEETLRAARAEAERFEQQVAGGMMRVDEAQRGVMGSAASLAGWWQRLKIAAAGAIGVFGIRSIAGMADEWSDLNSLLAANVGGTDNAKAALARLEVVARRTYSSLSQTTQSFVYNARALKDLGYSTARQLDFSEALNNAMVVSGARGQRAAAVQNALSKAMGLGRLQGQELNTVMAMGGRVAEVLAEELGVTVSELKRLSPQGKITADVIANALIKNLERLREEADAMPATLQDSFILMGNAVLAFVGRFDKAFGITEALAKQFVEFGDVIRASVVPAINLTRAIAQAIASGLTGLGVSMDAAGKIARIFFITILGTAALFAVRALTTAVGVHLVAALNAFGNAVKAHPVIAIVAALIGAVYAAYEFRDAIKKAIGVDVVGIFVTVGNAIADTFVGMLDDVKRIFSVLPEILRIGLTGAVNVAVRAVNMTIAAAYTAVNTLINLAEKVAWVVPGAPRIEIPDLVAPQIPELGGERFDAEMQKITAAFAGRGERWKEITATDYVGSLLKLLETTDPTIDALTDLDAALAKLNTGAGEGADVWRQITDNARGFIEQQEIARLSVGMSAEAAAAFRYEMDMLNTAIDAGIKLTPAQVLAVQEMAGAMAHAEAQAAALNEQFGFSRELFGGFVSDIRQSLKEGESLWAAFANAALNALDKIIDKLLGEFIDAIFEAGSVLKGQGGFGGFLTSLVGMLTGAGAGFGGGVNAGLTTGFFYHSGTRSAGSGGYRRQVSPLVFAGARRMHDGGLAGLASDEVPAILKRGEPVGAAAGRMGGISISVNVDARGAEKGAGSEIAQHLTQFVQSPQFRARVVEAVNDGFSRRQIRPQGSGR
jgi:tape measure domain-containing protein